ncbi:hypothetical protein BZA77DRAFT_327974 [Pyronema omphalodes]|nr:hypothetical protein BZA77DRAFT_327974 [Pyronema omphalodes]
MDEARDQAREHLARLRTSMAPRVDQVTTRLREVPAQLQALRNDLRDTSYSHTRNSSEDSAASENSFVSSVAEMEAEPDRGRGLGLGLAYGHDDASYPRPRSRSRSPSDSVSYTASPTASPTASHSPSLLAPPLLRAPQLNDPAYDPALAQMASKILYRSGRCPVSSGPLLVLCAAAFPDAAETDYNALLPYVLSNLPGDEELMGEQDGYSVVFFAGGSEKKEGQTAGRPTWKWTLQAYTLLGRAVRKKIQRLWVVHEKSWIRTILEIMVGVVSVKFRRKIVHLSTLSELASHIDITRLEIPPSVYLHDRKLEPRIILPGFPQPPIFGGEPGIDIPVVLQDTTSYILRHHLTTQGLFRVTPSAALLECARDCYDRRTSLNWIEWGPHTAAGLIKLYYRQLPRPMIPVEHYEQMQSLVALHPDPSKQPPEEEAAAVRFEVVRALLTSEVGGLPDYSRRLFLQHLFPLMKEVAAHHEQNKMTITNLAVCIAGSLARSDDMVADARASGGIRKFVEIAVERIGEIAPPVQLRRSGAEPGHKRTASAIAAVRRTMPPLQTRWEPPVRKQTMGEGNDVPLGDLRRQSLPNGSRKPPEMLRVSPSSPLPIRKSSLTPVTTVFENTMLDTMAQPVSEIPALTATPAGARELPKLPPKVPEKKFSIDRKPAPGETPQQEKKPLPMLPVKKAAAAIDRKAAASPPIERKPSPSPALPVAAKAVSQPASKPAAKTPQPETPAEQKPTPPLPIKKTRPFSMLPSSTSSSSIPRKPIPLPLSSNPSSTPAKLRPTTAGAPSPALRDRIEPLLRPQTSLGSPGLLTPSFPRLGDKDKPVLRRVASASFAGEDEKQDREGQKPGLVRRARSQLLRGEPGKVGDMKKMWESKGRVEDTEGSISRRGSVLVDSELGGLSRPGSSLSRRGSIYLGTQGDTTTVSIGGNKVSLRRASMMM